MRRGKGGNAALRFGGFKVISRQTMHNSSTALTWSAMQLWFARGSEVSIRQQLVTQVVLGILGDELARASACRARAELARRFHLHPNTVSAGYRQLARDRWVENRGGSGVFVRARRPEVALSPGLALDQVITGLFRAAREQGVSLPFYPLDSGSVWNCSRPIILY